MSEKIPCARCAAPILTATADRTGGLCMPCKHGNRENVERAKEYHRNQKKYNPVRELWASLVFRVCKTEDGFSALNDAEKLYWTVSTLNGEVYNGGMHQFFTNSSGGHYCGVIDGLLELRAFTCLKLLLEAKEFLFGSAEVPANRLQRNQIIKEYPETGENTTDWCVRLEQINREYWKDPDDLGGKLEDFANVHGLIEPFRKQSDHANFGAPVNDR